ncbi:Fe-S cluster assembly protein SufD [Natronoglycomyces albus]|uniref:Fe-S cluster assembly protein SufD n=1 Tax=Natronoglycomyces albus TaxID=2811108 RepID=A0A895XNH2_9ACTN|nr:Fe-S cluster assembly protein SufD [Natronoglycomyces albus]QSB03860.1 Fe-S cluster assembly protein SufD [Natronoglycomyces albus]
MTIEATARPHSHGAGSEVPPKTKSQLLRSFDPADFPALTGREEDWRFTPLRRIGDLANAEAKSVNALTRGARNVPAGVSVSTVAKTDERLGSILTPFDRPSASAWDNSDEALLIAVDRGAVVESPVVVDIVGTSADAASWAHTFIDIGETAEVTLILRHSGSVQLADNIEIAVGNGANVTIVSLADWNHDAVHLQHQKARLGRDAKLNHVAISLGGDLVRQFLSAEYSGRGGDVDAYGLYFADNGQHIEHRQMMDHNEPDCRSNVNYRGALQGAQSRTVWVGDVLIQAQATGTDTYEINRNLVLTDGARADSVPNLEIETGEIVGAGHASATGRFDENQLFYLQSRGIDEDEARKLVVRGFFNEVIQKVPSEELRDELTAAIESRLEKTLTSTEAA